MNVTYNCPACDCTAVAELPEGTKEVACNHCKQRILIPPGAILEVGDIEEGKGPAKARRLTGCVVCPSQELFVRKNFPQVLGVSVVVVAAIISSIFWFYRLPVGAYVTLFIAALIDLFAYAFVGNLLQCYRCQAQYRDVPGLEEHEGFDLETHEKYRQQAIRLAEANRQARALELAAAETKPRN